MDIENNNMKQTQIKLEVLFDIKYENDVDLINAINATIKSVHEIRIISSGFKFSSNHVKLIESNYKNIFENCRFLDECQGRFKCTNRLTKLKFCAGICQYYEN